MGVMGFLGDLRGRNSKFPPNPLGLAERGYSFHRLRAVPLPRGGRYGDGKIESRQNVGGRAMRELLPPLRRSPSLEEGGFWRGELQRLDAFATDGCTAVPCRGAHCAPVSYIAAPVTVITTMFREGARMVLGATAKPLYPIDGKAAGLDRRNPLNPRQGLKQVHFIFLA